MNLKQLEAFVWIIRLGGFGAAAAKLNATQPAISQRIHELEAELGVKLINRTQKSLSLTPKGRECLEFAENILDSAAGLIANIGSSEAISGRARLGVGESIALSWLPNLLAVLAAKYPNLLIDVVVDLAKPLCHGIDTGDFDVIILGGASDASQCKAIELGHATLAWMKGPSSETWTRPVTPKDLETHRILMLSHDTLINRLAEDWFANAGVRPKRKDICNSMAVLASLTMAGCGISLLPPILFRREIDEGRLIVISTTPPAGVVNYHALYRPAAWPPFGKIIAEIARQIAVFDTPKPSSGALEKERSSRRGRIPVRVGMALNAIEQSGRLSSGQ
jgi:DNA-binding transcriptional LysR family regulator